MAKLVLNDVSSGYASTTLVNANNTAIEAALENTLSRDGTGPNQMGANLDMNGYMILNQANPLTVSGFTWKGPWSAGTSYQVGDVVEVDGSSYIAISDHTSSLSFITDAANWQVVVQANLPSQTGNSTKFLQTNGLTASWEYPDAGEVTFLQNGSGAISKTAQSKMGEVISVKDFGAVGDGNGSGGGTDNTAAFIAALATGKAIYVPEGIYRVDGSIALEASPAASLFIYGESGIHTGVSGGKTVIDLTNNTTYFVAVGYAPTFRDLVFKGGVNVIHYSSQGLDGSTARLENVRALQWTGTFFNMFGAGNGSNIQWDRCVLISNNDSAIVFDSTGLAGTTDSLEITKGWIETKSTVGFKCKIARVIIDGVRFIPYTNSISPANSVWFDFYTSAYFTTQNVDFGGESLRQIINWRTDGGSIYLLETGISSIANIYAINLVGAPNRILFNTLTITPGQDGGTARIINIDPTMSSTSKTLLSQCDFRTIGGGEDSKVFLSRPAAGVEGLQLISKLADIEKDIFIQTSDVVVFGGSSWVTSSNSTNVTVVTAALAPDPLGAADFGFKGTATADNASFTRLFNNSPDLASLSEGGYTYEVLCTIVGGFAKISLYFGSGNSSSPLRKSFYLSPGIHHLTFPLYVTTGMVKNLGVGAEMNNGIEVTFTRMRVCKGFYHSRKKDFIGTAVPIAANPIWSRGDRIVNTPTVGQPKAWICTVSGGPGTWVSEGNL